MSKSKSLKINTDSVHTREAIADYFRIYGREFHRYLKAYMNRLGEPCDPSVHVNNTGTIITVDSVAVDKGDVLYMLDDKIQTVPYSKVAVGTVYALVENGAVTQYIRRTNGETDDTINAFADLSQMVTNWNNVTPEMVDEKADEVESVMEKV